MSWVMTEEQFWIVANYITVISTGIGFAVGIIYMKYINPRVRRWMEKDLPAS